MIDKSLPLTQSVVEFCSSIGQGQRLSPSLELGLKVIEVLDACQAILDRATESVSGPAKKSLAANQG